MTCEERKDLIALLATGSLDAGESAELRAHLATGCPRCAGALAEAEASLAHLPLDLPPDAPPPRAWDQLSHRLAAAPISTTASPSAARQRTGVSWFVTLGMSAVAAAVGALIAGGIVWNQVRALREDAAPADARELQFVALAGNQQPQAHGHVLWDMDRSQWHVCVFDLKPLPPSKTYELWFITDQGKKVRATTLDVGPSGEAMVNVPVPTNIGRVTVAAVTDEAAGGVDQPQGQIQLVGKVE